MHGSCMNNTIRCLVNWDVIRRARNKHLRKYTESLAKKFSRESTIQKLFNLLLLSFDPAISHLTAASRNKKKEALSLDFRCLLMEPR